MISCSEYNVGFHYTDESSWEIDYLKKVYPEGKHFTTEDFYQLECFYTALLPDHYRAEMQQNVYTATLPGPSCGTLPCNCDSSGPDVAFSRDPLLKNSWPPCNIPGPDGIQCCSSVDAYKECYRQGKVSWLANDTWTGNDLNMGQSPPKFGQYWKPTLWPEFTLARNLYPTDWNRHYNRSGDCSNAWVEVLHSSFSITNVTYGVWFYRAPGSGIFINLGKTLGSLNKLDCLVQLGMSFADIADFVVRPFRGQLIVSATATPATTGLGGAAGLDYWLAGQTHTNLGHLTGNDTKAIARYLEIAAYGHDYNLNRICTTGVFDTLIVYLLRRAGFYSVQFTVQANLYNGFTTEIMVVGTSPHIYTEIGDVADIRVMDPKNLAADVPGGRSCTYTYPFSCLHCQESPATMNAGSNCTVDVFKFSQCGGGGKPPY